MKAEFRKVVANPRAAVSSAVATGYFRLRRVEMAGRVLCMGRPPILFTTGQVAVGPDVVFRGLMVRTEFGAVTGGAMTVGEHTFINEGCSIVAHHSVRIGANCRIGEFVGIFDTDHHAIDSANDVRFAPVEVGDNVWIGRAAIVLPGVTIGCNSVVASGSVVTTDVPVNTLVAGNPARVVRNLQINAGWLRS